jgi:hypothetical protein
MKRKRIMLGVLAIVLVGLVAIAHHLHRMAIIGAGYAAQQTCSCLFVSGRPLESCRGDLEKLAQRIVTLTPGTNEVRASSMLSSATARYEPGFGCMLEN